MGAFPPHLAASPAASLALMTVQPCQDAPTIAHHAPGPILSGTDPAISQAALLLDCCVSQPSLRCTAATV